MTETKPKVTLQERISRGEAQKGPTVPSSRDQPKDSPLTAGAHQVYPQLSKAQQDEQQKQAKLQATKQSSEPKTTSEETSTARDVSASKQTDTKEKKQFTQEDEDKIVAILKRFGFFEADHSCGTLQNIATKDLATSEIEESLLNAEKNGQDYPTAFEKKRLMPETEDSIKFRDHLHKERAPTFYNLYTKSMEQKGREKGSTKESES